MTLPYVRVVNYLSASALAQIEENPVDFYYRRLGPSECIPPKEPQSFAAATGIAFDGHIKTRIASLTGLRCPSLAYLLNDVSCERERAIDLGAQLAKGYEASGALDSLLLEKMTALAFNVEDFATGTSVPLQAKLDATTGVAVHDWKVAGANKPGTRSPTQGYFNLWDTSKPRVNLGPHKKAADFMEVNAPDWATQLSVYYLALGLEIQPRIGSIDEVIVGAEGRVRVAQHRGIISKPFQLGVRQRLVDAWAKIRECRVVPEDLAEAGEELLSVMR